MLDPQLFASSRSSIAVPFVERSDAFRAQDVREEGQLGPARSVHRAQLPAQLKPYLHHIDGIRLQKKKEKIYKLKKKISTFFKKISKLKKDI